MTASITLEGPDNLIRHIESLQATLTKRNAAIDSQRREIERLIEGEPSHEGLKKAYHEGYKAAWNEAEEALRDLRGGIQKFGRDRYQAILAVNEMEVEL